MVRERFSKLIFVSVICLSILCSYTMVSAKESNSNIYYTNDNGVSLTKEEYDFLTKLYWDGYQKMMTKKEYDKFIDKKMMQRKISEKSIEVYDTPLTRGTIHSTTGKTLKIVKSCDEETETECLISATLTWNGIPYIQSYDVMGAFLDGGIELTDGPDTRVYSTADAFFTDDLQQTSEGFGSSFKLPAGTGHIINQSFDVKKLDDNAHVYASYQHSRFNTTLAVSRNYKIDITGSGHVFDFGDDAYKVYDHMNGVDIWL